MLSPNTGKPDQGKQSYKGTHVSVLLVPKVSRNERTKVHQVYSKT